MVKIIETNISLTENDDILDFQSRVIEVNSWDDFVREIQDAKTVIRTAAIGSMFGNTVPRSSKIEILKCSDNNLICNIYNYQGIKTKKLAYLINEH